MGIDISSISASASNSGLSVGSRADKKSGGSFPRDIVQLSPDGQGRSVMGELAGSSQSNIDGQISDAAEKLQRLKQAIDLAAAGGDAETLELLADKVAQVAVQLGGLLGKIVNRNQRQTVQDLIDLAKTLKTKADAAAQSLKTPAAQAEDRDK
jgi:hypothetical protein